MSDDAVLGYDFAADPRWLEHLDELSLSDNSDAEDGGTLILLAKQNWYRQNVDPTYQPDIATVEGVEKAALKQRKHMWEEKSFGKPTFCEVCGKLLWGMSKQGVKCRGCKAICHRKCQAEAEEAITCRFDAPAPVYVNTHELFETSFSTPTYCNVCRKVLKGIRRQGLSCSQCSVCCHESCKPKLLIPCKTTHNEKLPDPNAHTLCRWIDGNISKATDSACIACGKEVGSRSALTDFECAWCRSCLHTHCKTDAHDARICDFGSFKELILQPTWIGHGPDTHCVDDDPAGACITDLIVDVPPDASPLLVFINKRSGGQMGSHVVRHLSRYLNPLQIFDLARGGPAPALRAFKNVKKLRILVCGGDGSVGWVLSVLDQMQLASKPPVAILPLGTGNDLARTLGWGGGYTGEPMKSFLIKLLSAEVVMLDRWSLLRSRARTAPAPPQPTEQEGEGSGTAADAETVASQIEEADAGKAGETETVEKEEEEAQAGSEMTGTSQGDEGEAAGAATTPPAAETNSEEVGATEPPAAGPEQRRSSSLIFDEASVINNYFSVGFDAKVALGFHTAREANPEKFKSRSTNKMAYFRIAAKDYFADSMDLQNNVKLYCDGAKVELHGVQALIAVNLPSYSAGIDMWNYRPPRDDIALTSASENLVEAEEHRRDEFRPQSISDGLIEIVGVKSIPQVAKIYANISSAERLCQGREVVIELLPGTEMPVQVDGEPWLQQACTLRIVRKNQVPMLASKKARVSITGVAE